MSDENPLTPSGNEVLKKTPMNLLLSQLAGSVSEQMDVICTDVKYEK